MKDYVFEVCTGGVQDCINAQLGGADRAELNSALSIGGLTPTISTLKMVKEKTTIKIVCMVRPRAAGFCYNEIEKKVMFKDAEELLKHGADGISFGFLNKDATIDVESTKKMVELVHRYQGDAVFHRAFDCVSDPDTAIQQLIQCGVDRILTSGLQPTAYEGKDMLKTLQAKYGQQIQLLAGSGVNANNINELREHTCMHQFHSSCKMWEIDPTTTTGNVSFAFHNKDDYEAVSLDLVKQVAEKLRGK